MTNLTAYESLLIILLVLNKTNGSAIKAIIMNLYSSLLTPCEHKLLN